MESSSSSSSSSVRIKFVPYSKQQRKPMTFTHSPMVMAMLTNNSLSNCQDVISMMEECQRTHSDDQLCQTAANYMANCSRNGNARS
jgi:hypothetical protein